MKRKLLAIAFIAALTITFSGLVNSAEKAANDIKITGSGQINGGDYNKVSISGSAKVNGDVKAQEIRNSGSLDAVGNISSKLVHSSGSLKIEGNLEADLVESSGTLKVSGKMQVKDLEASGSVNGDIIQGNTVNVSGGFKVPRDVTVKSFSSSGGLDIGGVLNADKIKISINGDSKIGSIKGKSIEIKRLLDIIFRNSRLNTDRIEGDEVALENVNAKFVKGRTVKLGSNCNIDVVEYKETISVDSGAKVGKQQKK
jgi:cytoskeletal protein CcmA (bactofilin family)